MARKKAKRRGNGAHANLSSGLQHQFSKYLKNPVAVALFVVVLVLIVFMFLSRAPNVRNVNSCVSGCTFYNN